MTRKKTDYLFNLFTYDKNKLNNSNRNIELEERYRLVISIISLIAIIIAVSIIS